MQYDAAFVRVLTAGLWLSFTAALVLDLHSQIGKLAGLISSVIVLMMAPEIIEIFPGSVVFLKAFIIYKLIFVLWTIATSNGPIGMSILLGFDRIIDIYKLVAFLGLIVFLVRCFYWTLRWLVDHRLLALLIRLISLTLFTITGMIFRCHFHWSLSLTLIVRASVILSFHPQFSTIAQVGVGYFKPSLAKRVPASMLSLLFSQAFPSILIDPRISYPATSEIGYCQSGATHCLSFFFPGGIEYLAHLPPVFWELPDNSALKVVNALGLMVHFWNFGSDSEEFKHIQTTGPAVCQTYGSHYNSFRICLHRSAVHEVPHLLAWSSVCPSEISQFGMCHHNTEWKNDIVAKTAMSYAYMTADTVYSRKNNTILSVANLSPSLAADEIEIDDILSALERVFTADTKQIDHLIPDETTTALVQWVVDFLETSDTSAATSLLQAILVTPLLYFQPTYAHSHFPSFANIPLPSYLTVKVEYGEIAQRVVIDEWTVILFLVFSLLIYVTYQCGCFGH